jgi:hypothetical protein
MDKPEAKMMSKGTNDCRDRNIRREERKNKVIKKKGKKEKIEKTEELNIRNERDEEGDNQDREARRKENGIITKPNKLRKTRTWRKSKK